MKYFWLITIIVLSFGCSVNKPEEPSQPQSEPTFLSTNYYAIAETAFENKDFATAVDLFKRAAQEDPKSIHIKERLLETLALLSYSQKERAQELITLGEKYYASKVYSAKMLQILADTYRMEQNYERANYFYEAALEKEKTMRSLAMYYVFRKEYFPPTDKKLLFDALDLPWKKKEEVLLVASLISEIDAEKGLEILTQAYEKWDDEQTMKSLLSAFDKAGNQDKILQLIQQRLDDGKPVSDPLVTFLVGKYFTQKDWDKVLKNKTAAFAVGTEEILKFVFFSAINKQDFETGIKAGEILEDLGNIKPELQPSFYAYLAKLYFDAGRKTDAAEALAKSNDLDALRDFIFKFPFEQDEQIFNDLVAVLQEYNNFVEDKNHIHYLLAMMYTSVDEKAVAAEQILSIDAQSLVDRDMNFTAATLLLQNSDNYEKAIELIELAPDSVYISNEIVSSILYGIGKDSLSYVVALKELSENSKPHVSTYLRYSIVAEQFASYDNMKRILLDSIDLYPENADLKNALGYSIAKNEYSDDFELAYKLLEEAVKLKPDSEMIWDSLAWLYYVDDKPEKALAAMKIPLSKPVENSEIAFHLGAIYWKLGQKEMAQKYLKIAIEVNDDPISAEAAENLLEEITLGEKK
ncbi:MAG: hypothetical protein K9N09_07050 [Candidatus Cloacimonetes bacterium]|nr:hypothetical protein [Candidatus Cloacimonadota bacterium]MCF7814235.1 hypothetical protein [Candidatus Cloacimonadota bacterium]MCF7868442.1 hypothetical protein [Candidatus Cloacimonadota bacterium]MCF7883938.1 hypothetical protein [Candidatus Cloacimonadota bacterium]